MESLKQFYSSNLESPSFAEFDEDFRQILQVFYYLGFLKLSPSKLRVGYGIFIFFFIVLTYGAGVFGEVLKAWAKGNLGGALISVIFLTETISFSVQILTFAFKQSQVIRMMRSLQSMHGVEDESAMKICRKRCLLFIQAFKYFMLFCELVLTILKLSGFDLFVLVVPVTYETLANGSIMYPLLFVINVIHFAGLAIAFGVSELIHVLCMIRAEANLSFLETKIRHCADSNDLLENEKKLISCIKYYSRITRETRAITKIFKPFFGTLVHAMLFEITFSLFILLHIDFGAEIATNVVACLCVFLSIFQFGMICFFGQQVTDRSEELLNASYDCKWFDQTKEFKKNLIFFRLCCLKEIKLTVALFDFSRECFYKTVSNAYYYCNSMNSMVRH